MCSRKKVRDAISAVDSANPRKGFSGNLVTFALNEDNMLRINLVNAGLDISAATARWFVLKWVCAVRATVHIHRYLCTISPENTNRERLWESTYGAPTMCLYRRLDAAKNKFFVIVNETMHELEVPTGGGLGGRSMEYSNVQMIVSAMQSTIANDADLQADLTANSATVTLSYNLNQYVLLFYTQLLLTH